MLKPSITNDSISRGCRRFRSFMASLGPFSERVDEMMAVTNAPMDSLFG
uniref:NRPD902 n=1 Tax=Arundo donax TaxID=35708 RepID=A0A0A8YYE0_ARUDO